MIPTAIRDTYIQGSYLIGFLVRRLKTRLLLCLILDTGLFPFQLLDCSYLVKTLKMAEMILESPITLDIF